MRSHIGPLDNRRQRMLAIIAATAGLLLGGFVGASFADEPASVDSAAGSSQALVEPTQSAAVPTMSDTPWVEGAGAEEVAEIALMPLIFKVTLGLGLVVLLAWGTVYLLRRTTLGQGMSTHASAVRVLDRNWLGPKKAIYVVDIAGRTLALGVTEESITALTSWEEGEIDLARPETTQGGFADQFRTMLQRNRSELAPAGGEA